MKKTIISTALVVATLAGCASMHARLDRKLNGPNPYIKQPFYMRYVGTTSALDRQITATVNALREDPQNAALHNDLGALLLEKGFAKDATTEFRRAVDYDPKLYAAWYNLGLVRESQGDSAGAERAFHHTVDLKPGHAAAHFQLGLIEEKNGHLDAAVAHYARAFHFNRALLDVRVNPRILDTKLADRALLSTYELDHAEASAEFQATPAGSTQAPRHVQETPQNGAVDAPPLEAPSKQPNPAAIVSPAPSTQDLTQQAPRTTSPGGRTNPPPAQSPAPPQSPPQSPQAPPQSPQAPPQSPNPQGQNAGGAQAPPVFTLRPDASSAATSPDVHP